MAEVRCDRMDCFYCGVSGVCSRQVVFANAPCKYFVKASVFKRN